MVRSSRLRRQSLKGGEPERRAPPEESAASAGVPSPRLERRSLERHAVLAGQNALDDLDHCPMPLGCLRVKSSFAMRGGNIGKQVAHFLFADDFAFATRKCLGPPSRRLHRSMLVLP
jgi:hypothetical protein